MSTLNTPGNDGGYTLDKSKLERALWERFGGTAKGFSPEGMDDLITVAQYGCSAGVSGFIYSTELAIFFDEHEEDIEEVLQELQIPLTSLVKDLKRWTFQEMKETAVWIVVEEYARLKVNL